MRRVSASLLLAVLGLAPIVPALLADDSSSLPACCRRFGKHHCALYQDSGSPGLAGVCESYRGFHPVAASPGNAAAAQASGAEFALLAAHAQASVQPLSLFHGLSESSRPKRGPPALFL